MTDLLQLRHWQQIKQAQALEYAGTPDRNAALVESKRHGLAADRIDELAAQVEVMREALEDTAQALAWQAHGECRGFSNRLLPSNDALDKARKAISLPSHAATILRQRDARTLREAADSLDAWGGICEKPAHDFLRKLADAMENRK